MQLSLAFDNDFRGLTTTQDGPKFKCLHAYNFLVSATGAKSRGTSRRGWRRRRRYRKENGTEDRWHGTKVKKYTRAEGGT